MDIMSSRINPNLDIESLAANFQRDGKVRITNILEKDFAEKVYRCLRDNIPWRLMFFDHQGKGTDVVGKLYPQQMKAMTGAQKQALINRIHLEAQEKYQAFYEAYDVLEARRNSLDPDLYVHQFLDFMGSDELFDFVRKVSQDELFNRVDCHACRYLPGYFLKEHVDASPFENRRMAYVFYFTKNWQVDYGGLTLFMDEDQQMIETFMPEFNALTLFKVPVPHSVSMVANFAPRPRYSITGWFTQYE